MTKLEEFADKIDAKIDSRLPQSPEAIKKRRNRILRPAAVVAGAVVVAGGVKVVDMALDAADQQAQHVQEVGEQHLENQRQNDPLSHVDDSELEP